MKTLSLIIFIILSVSSFAKPVTPEYIKDVSFNGCGATTEAGLSDLFYKFSMSEEDTDGVRILTSSGTKIGVCERGEDDKSIKCTSDSSGKSFVFKVLKCNQAYDHFDNEIEGEEYCKMTTTKDDHSIQCD